MGSTVGRRLEALEKQAAEASKGRPSSLQAACADARERATAEEISEMEGLYAKASERGEPATPEKDARYFELWEAILYRVSPGWAEETRIFRDLLCRQLNRLDDEWSDAGRQRSTWLSDREYWAVATAVANRSHALRRGAEAMTDAEEVAETVAVIREPGTPIEELPRLVGW